MSGERAALAAATPAPQLDAALASEIGLVRPTTIDRPYTWALASILGVDGWSGADELSSDEADPVLDVISSPALLAMNIKVDGDPRIRDHDELVAFFAAWDSLDDLAGFNSPRFSEDRFGFELPDLDARLRSSRGLMIFRDDALYAIQRFGHLDLNRATGILQVLESTGRHEHAGRSFCAGAINEAGLSPEQAQKLWFFIMRSTRSLRDRESARVSANLFVQLDRLGRQEPARLCAALFDSRIVSTIGPSHALRVADKLGILVEPPRLSRLLLEAAPTDERTITLGLTSVIGLDRQASDTLVANRRGAEPVNSLPEAFELAHDMGFDPDDVHRLIKAGVFDEFAGSRGAMRGNVWAGGTTHLHDSVDGSTPSGEIVADEFDVFGFSITFDLRASARIVEKRDPRMLPRVCGVLVAEERELPHDPEDRLITLATASGPGNVLISEQLLKTVPVQPRRQQYIDAVGQQVELPGRGLVLRAMELRVEAADVLVRREDRLGR